MTETKVVLSDVGLPTQWVEGEERGAFWGISHQGETAEFHDHVAVLTVRDNVAVGVEFYHSEDEARRAADVPIYYGMFSNEGNRRVGLLICCTIEGVEQGRERSLVTAAVRDTITDIKCDHGEVTDTAVREHIFAALAPIFQHIYGAPLAVDEIHPRLTRTAKVEVHDARQGGE